MDDTKYVFRLRRGTRYVNQDGVTLLNLDGTPVRDDWRTYTEQAVHIDPLEGELVLEYEVVPETGKKTPRLKIGDGVSTFAELPYISVDSFILPTPTTITLLGGEDHWTAEYDNDDNLVGYTQVVQVKNYAITPNSKVDIQPSPELLAVFHAKDVTFTAVTDTVNGVTTVTVHAVGQMPQNTYENIQVTVTEVVANV